MRLREVPAGGVTALAVMRRQDKYDTVRGGRPHHPPRHRTRLRRRETRPLATMEPRRRRQTALVVGVGVLMLLLFTATLDVSPPVDDVFTGKVLAPSPVLATSTAPGPASNSGESPEPVPVVESAAAYNVSLCIAPVCYRRGNLQASCVVEQEVACLEWMATESDCVQGGLPVPPSPVHSGGPVETVRYHMYWAGALTRVALLSLKSFLVTQPAASTRLTLWTTPPGDSAGGRSPADLVALLANGDPEAATVLTWAPRVEVRAFRVADEWAAIRADFDGIPADLRLPDAPGGGQPVGFSDLVRLIVLDRYGGVYVDMDVLFVRDLSPLLHIAPFVYGWGCDDDLINTAVFALAARSNVAWALMNAALDRVRLLAPFFERHGRTCQGCRRVGRARAGPDYRVTWAGSRVSRLLDRG